MLGDVNFEAIVFKKPNIIIVLSILTLNINIIIIITCSVFCFCFFMKTIIKQRQLSKKKLKGRNEGSFLQG